MAYWMWRTSELAKFWYALQIAIGIFLVVRYGQSPIVIGVVMLIVLNCASFFRCCAHAELDDLHPLMKCEKLEKFLEHPRLTKIWIVPWYQGVPITADKAWCDRLRRWAHERPGRVLGLHGFAHTDHECARTTVTDAMIDSANEMFYQAFGEYPTEFKAPNYALSNQNRETLENRGFRIATKGEGMFHQVFHCDTSYCLLDCKDIVQAHI